MISVSLVENQTIVRQQVNKSMLYMTEKILGLHSLEI